MRERGSSRPRCALLFVALAGCGDADGPAPDDCPTDAGHPDAPADAGRDGEQGGAPDGGDGVDGGASVPCPFSLNPTGEFANVLIRGRAPDGPFEGNTWAAIADSDERGFDYVEVDVRLSADGFLVPARDDGLGGWSTCAGSLASKTADELAECLYSGTETSVRPIDDGLEGTSFRGIYLDLKSTHAAPLSAPAETAAAVRALAELLGASDTLVGMSYEEGTVDALLAEGVRAALKGYYEPDEVGPAFDLAAEHSAEMVCLNVTLLDSESLARARDSGLWILAWAYDEQVDDTAMRLLADGQAGGLISSVPDLVEAMLCDFCE